MNLNHARYLARKLIKPLTLQNQFSEPKSRNYFGSPEAPDSARLAINFVAHEADVSLSRKPGAGCSFPRLRKINWLCDTKKNIVLLITCRIIGFSRDLRKET